MIDLARLTANSALEVYRASPTGARREGVYDVTDPAPYAAKEGRDRARMIAEAK